MSDCRLQRRRLWRRLLLVNPLTSNSNSHSRPVPDDVARPSPALLWLLAALVFAGCFLFRFLDVDLSNDDFAHISRARQIARYGEIPGRDFVDPGNPLRNYLSAAIMALFGDYLLGEVLMNIFFISLGAALTFLLAAQASHSLVIALIVTTMAVAMGSSLYNYPKVILYVLGPLVCWRYVDNRRPRALILVGLSTAVAFLFRHDHGAYIGLAALAMLVATHWREGARLLLRQSALYTAVVMGLLLPFFMFLALNGGVLAYFKSGMTFTRKEGVGQRSRWPTFQVEPSAPLFTLTPPPPPVAPRIDVRWAKGVPAEVRVMLEHRYHLREGRFRGDRDPRRRTWEYTLLDVSVSNVSGLVEDPHAEDTAGIDRATYRVPRPPEPRFLTWQRQIPLLRLSIAPGLFHQANAVAWLYYLFVSLPMLAILTLLVRRRWPPPGPDRLRSEAPKIICAAVLCAAAAPVILRSARADRLSDLAAPTAVLGAWLLGEWLGRRSSIHPLSSTRKPVSKSRLDNPSRYSNSGLLRVGRVIVVVGVLGLTWTSIVAIAQPNQMLKRTALLSGPQAVMNRGAVLAKWLAASPPIDAWAPVGSLGLRGLVRYVRECTKPTDRLLVTWYEPEVYFYSGRGFAGGHVFFLSRHFSSPSDQQLTIARLQAQSVPIVLADVSRYEDFQLEHTLVHDYLETNYQNARESGFGSGHLYRVQVARRAVPSGTYEPFSLPCFR